jgi:hypothetical protein
VTEASAASRSTFVTVLAWVLIVGAGFLTFISVMQALTMSFFMSADWSSAPPKGLEAFPRLIQFLLSNVRLFFLFNWLLVLLTFVSSIGLLYRRNWSRIVIISVFILGILINLGGVWLQSEMFSSMPQFTAGATPGFTEQMQTSVMVMRVGSAVFAVAISGLLGWLVWRLQSRSVRAEFGAL